MIMTYDCLVFSGPEFKAKIKEAINSNQETELIWDEMHRIRFDPNSKYAFIRPFSATSRFHYKILPMKISYCAVLKLVEGDFDYFSNPKKSDIIPIDS